MHCLTSFDIFVVTYRVTNFLPKLVDMFAIIFYRKNWISISWIALFLGIAQETIPRPLFEPLLESRMLNPRSIFWIRTLLPGPRDVWPQSRKHHRDLSPGPPPIHSLTVSFQILDPHSPAWPKRRIPTITETLCGFVTCGYGPLPFPSHWNAEYWSSNPGSALTLLVQEMYVRNHGNTTWIYHL